VSPTTSAPTPAAIGARVQRLRWQAGLTQAALAALCGTSQQSVCRIEAGRQALTLERAHALAEALGVTVGDLVGAS